VKEMAKEKKNLKECVICGLPVDESKGRYSMINGAVVGNYIKVKGHEKCLKNVDRIVVLQNRLRMLVAQDLFSEG